MRRLKDVEHNDSKLYLVFEWVDKDLKKYMDSITDPTDKNARPMVDMKLVKSYMYQVCVPVCLHAPVGCTRLCAHALSLTMNALQLLAGMEFCHARGIMHRDLKPQNLLVDKHGVLKVGSHPLSACMQSMSAPVSVHHPRARQLT